MATAAPRQTQKTDLSEVLNDTVRNRASVKTTSKAEVQEEAFPNIQANTFHQIMFSTEATPEEKKAAVRKALAFSGTKEENKARIKEFETFKEYLQHVREEMAQEIIRMTDTDAFSELKEVYDGLNTSLLDFDHKMLPLTEIIDAIYTLRTNGVTLDAFKEIQDDRKAQEVFQKTVEEISGTRRGIDDRLRIINDEIATLSEQKGFFGLGGIKESARVEIAKRKNLLAEEQAKLAVLDARFVEVNQQRLNTASNMGEFAEQKKKLRELLDISTDEHKDRQKALVAAALTFVSTAKERVGSVRSHLGKMNDQVENLAEANSQMTRVYAILNEGIKEASIDNQSMRNELLPKEGVTEDMITKLTRDEKKMAVEQHITHLDASAVDTMSTYADLTSQTIRIKSMRDANEAQINKARTMHTQGVAGVADRLSVVLQAVSSAALGESSAMAKDTLIEMATKTNQVAQKESIRIAMGVSETNDDLMKAIDDLGAYGEVIRTATTITREGVNEMRENLEKLQRTAKGVQEDISEAIAINADSADGPKKSEAAASKPTVSSPFKFGA